MTRKKAIDLLDNLIGFIEDSQGNDYDEAFKLAIKALKQEPCEDCISRQVAIDTIRSMFAPTPTQKDMVEDCLEIIENLPSAKQEPKTGHWIEQDGYDGDTYYDCSECGESFCLIDGTPTDNLYNYCPNCGAKMAESEET